MQIVNEFISANSARRIFDVTGAGLAVALLGTGLNVDHVDFAGRVAGKRNFTNDDDGDPDSVLDANGNSTSVAGAIVASGIHTGIAPQANIIPLKTLQEGGGSFQLIHQALQWALDMKDRFNISVVCLPLGDGTNHASDDELGDDPIRESIRQLREQRVPVVISAGNDFFGNGSRQGMSYPAIIRECISVGTVYSKAVGPFSYGGGAKAFSTGAGQIAPFSQRLHETVNRPSRTDIFAPGAPLTSSGIDGPEGESTQHGGSQSTGVAAGVILLMQEFHQRSTGELPEVGEIVRWLRQGAVTIFDGDDEDDNVENTYLTYPLVDVTSTLYQMRRELMPYLTDASGDTEATGQS